MAPIEQRTPRVRRLVGYLTILGALPYLVIKLAWVGGSTVGLADASAAEDGVLLAANVITLGMDAVAVLVVLALTHSWGERATAWAVLLPAWVGTGLLVPIVITFPIEAVAHLFLGEPAASGAPDFLQPWVRPVVYASFTAQGVGLTTAFVLYTRARWGNLLSARMTAQRLRHSDAWLPVTVPAVHRLGLAVAVALTAPAAVMRFLWTVGLPWGLPRTLVADSGLSYYLRNGMSGLLAVAALAGLAVLLRARPARSGRWIPVAVIWVGSGATWAWAVYGLAVQFAVMSPSHLGLLPWVNAAEALGGAVMAMLGLLLISRADEGRVRQPHTGRAPVPLATEKAGR